MNSVSVLICLIIVCAFIKAVGSIRKQKGHCQGCSHESDCPFRKLKK